MHVSRPTNKRPCYFGYQYNLKPNNPPIPVKWKSYALDKKEMHSEITVGMVRLNLLEAVREWTLGCLLD